MVLLDDAIETLQQFLALTCGKLIDPLREVADGVDGFPTCHRVCSNHRVHGQQIAADILRVSTSLLIDPVRRVGSFSSEESFTRECGGKALEEFLVRIAVPIIDLIARRPQSVAAC